MQEEVNLITQTKPEKKKSFFFSLSVLILLITIAVAIITLLIMLFLKTQVASIVSEQNKTIAQIKSQNTKLVEFLTVKERLLSIRKIQLENQELVKRVDLVAKNLPGGINIETFSISDKTVLVKFNSTSLAALNGFINNGLKNISEQKDLGIKDIVIQSFGVGGADGSSYSLAVQINYVKPI